MSQKSHVRLVGEASLARSGSSFQVDSLPTSHLPMVIAAMVQQARLRPDAVALDAGSMRVSYRALDRTTAHLARMLAARGIAPGDKVAGCFSDRVIQLQAMLATWRAGAVFVPLDPTHPRTLVQFNLQQTRPQLILSDIGASEQVSGFEQPCLLIDGVRLHESDDLVEWFGPALRADSTALILFTSGTTGQPKGVRITHGNIEHLVGAACRAYRFDQTDIFCTIARPTFSISLFEVCSPLCVGATLRVVKREEIFDMAFLTELLPTLTVLHAGPSLLSRLFRHIRDLGPGHARFPGMRHVSTGGDIVLPAVMEGLKEVFPQAELYVIYGCTETSCMSAAYPIPRDKKVERSMVGRPFPDVEMVLLSEGGDIVPQGAVGDICFSGPGVVAGYLDRPEVERERFITIDGRRYYRTGDLGRLDEALDLEFLGRNDFQVQIRGMRVELIGIENMVRELDLAEECAAALCHRAQDDDRLVLFVVRPKLRLAEIRKELGKHFPDFMIPQHVVPLSALPLTPNGKLDRRALTGLSLDFREDEKAFVFSSSIEERVAQTLERVIRGSRVGPNDNFFELGGHSLLAIEAAEAIKGETGLPITPAMILQTSTVRDLVHVLTSDVERRLRPILLTASEASENLFLFMGVHSYRELARALRDRFAVYGVFVEHEITYLEEGAEPLSVGRLAEQYIELMKRQQPRGPYRIGGHSFGGLIAYEAARKLAQAGDVVSQLVLIDAMVPEVGVRGFFSKLGRLATQPSVPRAWIKNRIEHAKRRYAGQSRARFGRFEGGKYGVMEMRRMDVYESVHRGYVDEMGTCAVPTVLVLAGGRLAEVPLAPKDGGWTPYLTHARVETIDARHLEILEPPWSDQLARIIAEGV